MIQVDISKVLPRPAFRYLLGLIPGMFFEISVLSADPGALRTPASLAGLGYWTTVGVALFIAFIIGSAAMLWVWLIQVCIGYLYRLRKVLWIKLLSSLFRSRKFPPRPNWITSNRWLNRAFQTATLRELEGARYLGRDQGVQTQGDLSRATRSAQR